MKDEPPNDVKYNIDQLIGWSESKETNVHPYTALELHTPEGWTYNQPTSHIKQNKTKYVFYIHNEVILVFTEENNQNRYENIITQKHIYRANIYFIILSVSSKVEKMACVWNLEKKKKIRRS